RASPYRGRVGAESRGAKGRTPDPLTQPPSTRRGRGRTVSTSKRGRRGPDGRAPALRLGPLHRQVGCAARSGLRADSRFSRTTAPKAAPAGNRPPRAANYPTGSWILCPRRPAPLRLFPPSERRRPAALRGGLVMSEPLDASTEGPGDHRQIW